MSPAGGEYEDWKHIDFQPPIADLVPLVVTAQLDAGQLPADGTALDVGCNRGGVSLFLAQHGLHVLGVDLNGAAIDEGNRRAAESGLSSLVNFKVADILKEPLSALFDVVLLIRILTCFPAASDWQALLKRAGALVGPHVYLYVHDFLLSPGSGNYRARYAAGAHMGWRPGNFAVNDADGALSFIAHHHSEEEVAAITAPWQRVDFSIHQSLSLNGNSCRMFEFLGRKPG